MKNTKLFISLAVVAMAATFTFSSCDPEPFDPGYTLAVVDFEAETLPAAGYIVEADYAYTEKGLTFIQYFADWGGGVTSWSGTAVSNKTDKETAGYTNQYSVYGTGGQSGSQFGVVYYSSWDGPAECGFETGKEYEIDHVYVTNSTYAYLAIKNGDEPATAFAADSWFKLTITGYNAAGAKTAEKDVYLADYRDGKSNIMSKWTKVDLASLGKVNKLGFTFSSTDNDPENGMNTPSYACIDNLAYRVYPE